MTDAQESLERLYQRVLRLKEQWEREQNFDRPRFDVEAAEIILGLIQYEQRRIAVSVEENRE